MDDHLVASWSEVRELDGEPGDGVLRRELDHRDVTGVAGSC